MIRCASSSPPRAPLSCSQGNSSFRAPSPELTFDPEERTSCLAPSSLSVPRKEPQAISFSDIRLPNLHGLGPLPRFPFPLDAAQQQGFPSHKGSYAARISQRSKYSPISVGTIMDNDISRHANPYNQAQQSERL